MCSFDRENIVFKNIFFDFWLFIFLILYIFINFSYSNFINFQKNFSKKISKKSPKNMKIDSISIFVI